MNSSEGFAKPYGILRRIVGGNAVLNTAIIAGQFCPGVRENFQNNHDSRGFSDRTSRAGRGIMVKTFTPGFPMKLKTLALSLLLGLAASSTFAEDQYIVRVPANVNLSAPEAPQAPAEPLSLTLSADPLPAGMVGTPYEFNLLDRLSITGGTGAYNYSDATWSLKVGDVLPPGLAIEGDKIVGTPTAKNEAGTSFEVTGTYQNASGKQVYTIVVGGQKLLVTDVSMSSYHVCAVTLAGGVKCWGDNDYGQLGDGTKTQRLAPEAVQGLSSGVQNVSTGSQHSCALLVDGKIKCWGSNGMGRLGNDSTTQSLVPVDVVDVPSGVIKLRSRSEFNCLLTTSKELYCWGNGSDGRLGNATTNLQRKPSKISVITDAVKDFSIGNNYTCAITDSGAVKCWGNNLFGQLGNGTNTNSLQAVNVSEILSGAQSISSGSYHNCTILGSGDVKCWGTNGNGEIGDGTGTDRNSPVMIANLDEGVKILHLGGQHSCAVMNNGTAKCWGKNDYGQLGTGTATSIQNRSPRTVQFFEEDIVGFALGTNDTCMALASGGLKCWGWNYYGTAGDGTKTRRPTPVDVLP